MVSEERKLRVENNLKLNGADVTVLWGTQRKNASGRDFDVDVVCNKDGLVQTRGVSTLNVGAFKCQDCLNTKYSEKLIKSDFSLVRKLQAKEERGASVLAKCNKCGNHRKLSPSNVMNMSSIRCLNCREIEIREHLKSKDCTFVSKSSGNNNVAMVTYTTASGQTRVASEVNVPRGNFASADSHWDQKHHLYILKSINSDFPYFKIGTANIPERRLEDLKLTFDCEVLSKPFANRKLADTEESFLHLKFKSFNVSRELANTFTDGLSKRLKSGHRIKMGTTEWFHMDCFQDALTLFNKIG